MLLYLSIGIVFICQVHRQKAMEDMEMGMLNFWSYNGLFNKDYNKLNLKDSHFW